MTILVARKHFGSTSLELDVADKFLTGDFLFPNQTCRNIDKRCLNVTLSQTTQADLRTKDSKISP